VSFHDHREIRPALPDATEAECAVLGAIMHSGGAAYTKVSGFLKPKHFHQGEKSVNARLYGIMGALVTAGKPINPITIRPHIDGSQVVGRDDEDGSDVTLDLYIVRLLRANPTIDGAVSYARQVLNMWAQQHLIEAGYDLIAAARTLAAELTPSDLISAHSGALVTIAGEIAHGATGITMADAIGRAMESIDDAYKFKRRAGVATGIEAVDQLTGPWEAGQQIIIGGGTKQGKSALAMQCAIGLAASGPVWVYSGEMSVKQLAMREIARRTGIPVWRQKEGRISEAEWKRLVQIRQDVERLPILIEKRRLTLEQIHQVGRELKVERGLCAMVVDHVGLLAWGRDNAKRDEWEQSQIATRELKAIYEDLGIPGMSLVQLKKNTFAGDYRGRQTFEAKMREAINRRPKYTDLMGAVERDADHVLIPFNASKILAGLEPEAGSDDHILWEGKMSEHEHRAEIILALSREQNFPQRREVEWHGETTSFGAPFVGKQESLLGDNY